MSERTALVAAALAHLALLLLLSLGLSRALPPMATVPDFTPIDFIEIGAEPSVTRPPEPSMEAAPRDPGPPAPADLLEPDLSLPDTPDTPPSDAAADTAVQDAIAVERTTPPPRRAPQAAPAKPDFDAGQMAALIDKALPNAPVRPRDTSAFAKSIEAAIPKGVRVSPRAIATLEGAIRAQIAPCWNPPIGGADVANMTAVLKIRLARDGTVIGTPEFISQTGATSGNQAYARAFVETARRAVLRCAPLDLPADLYSHWREFELNFDPRLMT